MNNLSRALIRYEKGTGASKPTELHVRLRPEITVLLAQALLRLLHLVYRHFEGDMVLAIVLVEIGLHNVSRVKSSISTPLDKTNWDHPDIRKLLMPCNALSISQSAGIPRETVRRKIARLVVLGWLEQTPKGEAVITKAAGLRFITDFNPEILQALIDTGIKINELVETKPSRLARYSKEKRQAGRRLEL